MAKLFSALCTANPVNNSIKNKRGGVTILAALWFVT
jgi:hypothetical protein